ncbi:MAG: hypothetical protein JNK87_13515 [Bryobacterales bacterium]|nr:hypothetical protein [Bryobacterales bacterium]
MRRLSHAVLLFAFWMNGAAVAQEAVGAKPSQSPQLFEEIGEILGDLSKITGLPAPKTVASDTISKDGLKKFLEDRIKELVKPEEIRAEETTLKKLGLVPADFDLKKMTVDLLTEQAAAFYDYQKKKLFVIESGNGGGPDFTQRPVLVHELAHALADVHFNLEKYILKGKNDDAAVARQAVMEGQATWLMSEYMLFKMGTSLRKAPEMADAFNQVGGAAQGGFPVFDSSPLYLRESLLFPYTKGFAFQQAVIQKYGDRGFREVFTNPPASVQQILHPEKYFAKVVPTKPKLPKAKTKGYEGLIEGGVGELEHQILLRLYAEDQVELATKWRGGQVKILENRKTKEVLMLYASEWETEADAKAFYDAYQRILKGKKQEKAEVRVDGRVVTSVE